MYNNCLTCKKAIIGASDKKKKKGQDLIFCEGAACQGWTHKTYADLTKSQFIDNLNHKAPRSYSSEFSESISELTVLS